MKKNKILKPVIVTGLSGAGMSSVLKTLEDFGYEVFDNFPLSLVGALYKDLTKGGQKSKTPFAIGIDARTRGFSTDAVLAVVKKINARLLFITCDDQILQRRFTETRRRHPLSKGRSVRSGIEKERKLLEPLRDRSDLVIDTTDFSIHDLRHILEARFAIKAGSKLSVTLMSFAFRKGVPREADIVMDVRFLKNPHWVKSLKGQTGLDKAVGEYIRKDPDYKKFMKNFKGLVEPLLPRYAAEGKNYLTIAIGCSGGRHRSVYLVEELAAWLKTLGLKPWTEHRDLGS